VVIDMVGGDYSEPALRACRWGSRFVTVGYASGQIPRIPLNLVLLKGMEIKGFEIRTVAEHLPDAVARGDAQLWSWFAEGALDPVIGATFSLADTAQAMRLVEARGQVGKIIIHP
jgi:NADPH2:quinone reductase